MEAVVAVVAAVAVGGRIDVVVAVITAGGRLAIVVAEVVALVPPAARCPEGEVLHNDAVLRERRAKPALLSIRMRTREKTGRRPVPSRV